MLQSTSTIWKTEFQFQTVWFIFNHTVDESSIPYYGKRGTKQFIRGKSIRFGFKLWCITSSERYILHAEPYCGADTDFPDTGLGQGADVVLGLIEKCEVKAGSTATFDNLFTSLSLLDELTELGIGALGTLQQNHFHGAPVANKTTLAKKPRGSYDFATYGKNLVLSWLDNKGVTCVTNHVICNPVSTAQRWSKPAKKRVDVPMPKPFENYSNQMGGADLFDQFVSTYRVRIRSKKCWWPFFAWAVKTSMTNAWNLFHTLQKWKIGMLEFQREIVITILASFGRNKPAKSLTFPQNVASNVKLDTKNHLLVKGRSKYCCCKHCGGRSIYLCQRCYVVLHPDCFKDYH